jgi:hypothetical protein
MCFSASASFTAAAATAIAGGAALQGAARPSYRLLAAVPLLFAIHQFAEGILWLALSDPARAGWGPPAMLVYLAILKVVWPAWVPVAILKLETEPRRRLLWALVVFGAVLSPVLAYGLGAYPVSANIAGHHVQYRQDMPYLYFWFTHLGYPVAVVLPPLLASNRLVRFTGALVLASLVLTKIFFYYYFISVWCFFAAIISVGLVLAVRARPVIARMVQPEPGGG